MGDEKAMARSIRSLRTISFTHLASVALRKYGKASASPVSSAGRLRQRLELRTIGST